MTYIPHNWKDGELLRAEDLNHLEQGVLNEQIGPPGEDGVSPEVSVEEIPGGHRVTITDESGSKSFDIMDGLSGVISFNSRSGAVMPQVGDYTAGMVGARPDNWMPTASEVGARPDNWTPTAEEVDAIPAVDVKKIEAVTLAEYDALTEKDAYTLYLVKEEQP